MTAPLAGLRVLDLTRVFAGPWAGQILADMGADVIKVERPGRGDESRTYAPFLRDRDGTATDETPMFLAANRGKRSLSVDIAHAEGQALIRDLARGSDVLLENFKVGDLARYGLDYDRLHGINPRLVYCSLTGFGQTGPFRDRPGYDTMMQAMCGMMAVTGFDDGDPIKAGPSVVDLMTGAFAVMAVQGALYHRDARTDGLGGGQHIDLSLLDCGVAMLAQQIMYYLATGAVPPRTGNSGNSGMPGGGYRCRDGYMMIAPGNNDLYAKLCRALDRPDLIDDPRFVTNADRVGNRAALGTIVSGIFAAWDVEPLYELLVRAGVPASPVYGIDEVMRVPQVVERGMSVKLPHRVVGELPFVVNPIRYSETPLAAGHAPPAVGEHTNEILAGLGLDGARIAALRAARVI